MSRISSWAQARLGTERARGGVLAAGLGLLLILAYANSFGVPFIFDDTSAIPANRSLHRWATAFSPPASTTVSGRPLLNASFAVNWQLHGDRVGGYHAVNLLIHGAAALVLAGLVRRTLVRPVLAGAWGALAWPVAATVAGWWALHPLQTESVTYVVQRAESLGGLFHLLTLYAFVRSLDAGHPVRWQVASVAACLAGVATKETVVTAPLLVLLYDRTFGAGTFAAAWRLRRSYYLTLVATWGPLLWLVAGTGGRGGSAGLGSGVGIVDYALTQCRAVVHYLQLACWPDPLVLDYGDGVVSGLAEVWPQAVVLAGLLAAVLWALGRRPAAGFVGAWFFLLLAPSSSVVPIATQTMAEHRVYLALAAVVAVGALGLFRGFGGRAVWVAAAVALLLGVLTHQRNADYATDLGIWTDTVKKAPTNARAHYNKAVALAQAGRPAESLVHFREAVRLAPDFIEAHNNLGVALMKRGDVAGAMAHYEAALRYDPRNAEAHNNLGHALAGAGRGDEAWSHYREALRWREEYPEAHNNLGELLAQRGDLAAARAEFQRALALWSDYPEARNNLGNIYLSEGNPALAQAEYQAALRGKPEFAEALSNLGYSYLLAKDWAAARRAYERLLAQAPDDPVALRNLGYALLQTNDAAGARPYFEKLAERVPQDASAWASLGSVYLQLERADDAVAAHRRAVALQPGEAGYWSGLALALARAGRLAEARQAGEEALRRDPANAQARELLRGLGRR